MGLGALILMPIAAWRFLYKRGQQFALRDALRTSDAIVAVAGTRGNIKFLDGKVQTAVALYHAGWAPLLIFTGRFSKSVPGRAASELIPRNELEQAAKQGRISAADIEDAAQTWDMHLGASYMRDLAIKLGVPAEAIVVEEASLHTLENALFTLPILKERGAKRIVLVTSPFHQLRTFLTFNRVLQSSGIEIINHYADSDDWRPMTWFLSRTNRRLVRSELTRMRRYQIR